MSMPHDLNSIYALLRAGDTGTAASRCDALLRDAPDDVVLLGLLGYAQLISEQFEAAASTYRRLGELQPAEAANWNNLGLALRHTSHYAEAEHAFNQALARAPE